ncbi:YebG family protein [Colwellia sp. MB02u-10]|uniref:YebG family protein n=1 Tax=Colwellia sp. MB02u-10 TaxID=2759828 RepID=UPI0015F4609E|nr:YebG family protein [Colwellia sp. MB02u-10]MBA6342149.1 YebG family protein [Colwellia sp. MB02u-10]
MAVESRYVVIRKAVEVETFMDKRAADEYDKMLDIADGLSEIFEQAPVELSESIREELSVYLAQNREDVLVALQAKKAKVVSKKSTGSSPKKTKDTAELANDTVEADSVKPTTEPVKKPKAAGVKASSKAKSDAA